MEPEIHTILWRRLDLPGHEACRVTALEKGCQVSGTAVFVHERQACRLDYSIACDEGWRTVSAEVWGWVGGHGVSVEVVREPSGLWRLNGSECSEVAGCTDVDLNFSPSTNTLPVRRLALKIGQKAAVRAAWLRFPSFALEPLEQSYERLDTHTYRYTSTGGRFTARVGVDERGLVTEYGEIWAREETAK